MASKQPELVDAIASMKSRRRYKHADGPQWIAANDDLSDGWYWCESLDGDSPPQMLRSSRPMKFNDEDSMWSVDMLAPRVWTRWTVSGWVPLVGRVAACTGRPE